MIIELCYCYCYLIHFSNNILQCLLIDFGLKISEKNYTDDIIVLKASCINLFLS